MRLLPRVVVIPGKVGLTQLLNDILAQLRAQRVRPGPTTLVNESANGTTIQSLARGGVAAAPSAPIPTRRFVVNSVGGNPDIYRDYFIAGDVDNGGTLTRIAKNYKLRASISSQVIDGAVWNYLYTNVVERTASTAGYAEFQRVSERYLVGDFIIADMVGQNVLSAGSSLVSVPDTISPIPGAPIVWLDRNADGRAWTARADQSAP